MFSVIFSAVPSSQLTKISLTPFGKLFTFKSCSFASNSSFGSEVEMKTEKFDDNFWAAENRFKLEEFSFPSFKSIKTATFLE